MEPKTENEVKVVADAAIESTENSSVESTNIDNVDVESIDVVNTSTDEESASVESADGESTEAEVKRLSTKEIIAYLAEKFPACFSIQGNAKALKIGIFQDLSLIHI